MAQETRRPARRQRRRSPLPFLILVFLLLCVCTSTFSCTRVNSSADAAYARLVGVEPLVNQMESLNKTYRDLDKERLKFGIADDYESVIAVSKRMNEISNQLVSTEEQLIGVHKKRTDDFKKSTRWLIGWTARNKAAEDIAKACDKITRLRSELLALRRQADKLVRERNDLYIKYSREEISGDEFADLKTNVDARIAPVETPLQTTLVDINTSYIFITSQSEVFGVD